MNIQQSRGVEYGQVALDKVRGYLESLDHAERCQWLGGFIGYVAGAAGGLVGSEIKNILLTYVAGITEEVAKENSH